MFILEETRGRELEALHEEGAEARPGPAPEGVEHQEALGRGERRGRDERKEGRKEGR